MLSFKKIHKTKLTSNKINLLGVFISVTNITHILYKIENLLRINGKGYITVTGVHGIVESQRSSEIRIAHNASFMTVPDGMPLVYFGRMKGYSEMERCYGPNIMMAVMKMSVKYGYTHFIYGGKSGIAQELKKEMKNRYPGVKIVGTYTPPFRTLNNEEEKCINKDNK